MWRTDPAKKPQRGVFGGLQAHNGARYRVVVAATVKEICHAHAALGNRSYFFITESRSNISTAAGHKQLPRSRGLCQRWVVLGRRRDVKVTHAASQPPSAVVRGMIPEGLVVVVFFLLSGFLTLSSPRSLEDGQREGARGRSARWPPNPRGQSFRCGWMGFPHC